MPIHQANSATDVLREFVPDGAKLAVGGYFFYRHPMALVRALIRSERKNLEVISPFGSIDVDLLAGTRTMSRLLYGFVSLDVFGLAPNVRRRLETQEVIGTDYGAVTLARSLEAAYRGLPGLPVRSMLGSDLAEGHPGGFIQFGGERLFFAPALAPDVTLIHVPVATDGGALKIRGEGFDPDLAKAADLLIVSADRLASRREFDEFDGVVIARSADVLLEIPYGAHPTSCYPYYVHDLWHLLDYSETAATPHGLRTYVDTFVLGCPSHTEYAARIGMERLGELSAFADVASGFIGGR